MGSTDAEEIVENGLVLSRPEHTDPAEIEEFRAYYRSAFGTQMASFEPWIEFRPEVLKRFRMQVIQMFGEGRGWPLVRDLAFLQYYTAIGYEDGIRYEIEVSRTHGARRAEIVEALAISFIAAGPQGMHRVHDAAFDFLRDYSEPAEPAAGRWPAGWASQTEVLTCGLDHGTVELLPGELEAIEAWYRQITGEVPGFVALLGRLRPRLLKAFRARFETAIRPGGLPNQVLGYLAIHLAVSRRDELGIREAILLGRGLGLSAEQLMDAVSWGSFYGGPSSLSLVERAAGDVLRPS